jgi:DNA polymerase-3 subunit beta
MTTATALDALVLKENLVRALAAVKSAVPPRHAKPILSHVRIHSDRGELVIHASDLDMTITARSGAKLNAEGEICLPHRELLASVKAFPSAAIAIRQRGNNADIRCAGSAFAMRGMDAADWPATPKRGEMVMTTTAGRLHLALAYVLPFVADDFRPVLSGVNLALANVVSDGIPVVATDGVALAKTHVQHDHLGADAPDSIIIPARVAAAIVKAIPALKDAHLPVFLWRTDNPEFYGIGIGDEHYPAVTFTFRAVMATYPVYDSVIPTYEHGATVNRDVLKRAVDGAAKVANGGWIRFSAMPYGLRVWVTDEYNGHAFDTVVPIEGVWGASHAAFNGTYIRAALDKPCPEVLTWAARDGIHPSVFRDNIGVRVIMPATDRVTWEETE